MQPKRDYEVGRGKPPKHSQFRKGQSGNPCGRPRGAKNFDTLLIKALDEKVELTHQGERQKLSKRQVILIQLINKAAKGDLRAAKLVLDMANEVERRADVPSQPATLSDADREVRQFVRDRRVTDEEGEPNV